MTDPNYDDWDDLDAEPSFSLSIEKIGSRKYRGILIYESDLIALDTDTMDMVVLSSPRAVRRWADRRMDEIEGLIP